MDEGWLTIETRLIGGPPWFDPDDAPPGRIMLVGPTHTFTALAAAVNTAFARWDLAHLHEFLFPGGRRIGVASAEFNEQVEDGSALVVADEVSAGDEFTFLFDFGDGWEHACRVLADDADPHEEFGLAPSMPMPIWGWGWIPDQYGRRLGGEDDEFEDDVAEGQETVDAATLERREWTVPAQSGEYLGMDLSILDPGDEDQRHFLILSEHPELADAVERGEDEIEVDGQAMNPLLHITLHEVVANQLWHDSPPEVWETAQRLVDDGYTRHEVLHMLAGAMSDQIFRALQDQTPYDHEAHVKALEALPESWEKLRNA